MTATEQDKLEVQIETMALRFLTWRLPDDFSPDGGITFEPVASRGSPFEFIRKPVGTNLLNFEQAKDMVRHMLRGVTTNDRG